MTTDDHILRVGDGDGEGRGALLAGALEIDTVESRAGLAELIDRMSEDGRSAEELDRIAARLARLLVADTRVDGLLQVAR